MCAVLSTGGGTRGVVSTHASGSAALTPSPAQAKKKNFGVGNLQPRRDLSRFVKWPRYIRLQRQRRILNMRLKVPPAIAQFGKTLDVHGGAPCPRTPPPAGTPSARRAKPPYAMQRAPSTPVTRARPPHLSY